MDVEGGAERIGRNRRVAYKRDVSGVEYDSRSPDYRRAGLCSGLLILQQGRSGMRGVMCARVTEEKGGREAYVAVGSLICSARAV